jgi:hypothetical protein
MDLKRQNDSLPTEITFNQLVWELIKTRNGRTFRKSYWNIKRDGWIYAHLKGTPFYGGHGIGGKFL